MARAEVRGSQQMARNLRALSQAITPNVIRDAHAAALEPMQNDARSNFAINGSYVSGVIPANIVIVHTGRNETKLTMTGMGAKLGHLIELGTAPHEQPNRGTYHPGSAAKPFIRPAYEANAASALRIAGDVYGGALMKIARTLRI